MARFTPPARRRAAIGVLAFVATTVPLARSSPANAYNLLGPGCHFDVNEDDVLMNLNVSGDSDGPTATATADAALYWRQADTDAPDLWPYWPSPPVEGKGHLDIRRFTSSTSPNSGYLSTTGPTSFPAPSCGSSRWASRPNIWLNYTLIAQREAAGHATWNVSTVAHEAGHALGLAHQEGSGCGFMPLMDAHATHTNGCGVYRPTSEERAGVNKIYN